MWCGMVTEAQHEGGALAHHHRVAVRDGRAPHPADAEDRALRRVQHRREPVDAEAAEIGDRECAAFQLGKPEPVLAGLFRQAAHRLGDLAQAEAVGTVQHGHDEAVVDIDRDAEIDLPELPDAVVRIGRVEAGMGGQGGRGRLQDYIVDGRLELIHYQLLMPALMLSFVPEN